METIKHRKTQAAPEPEKTADTIIFQKDSTIDPLIETELTIVSNPYDFIDKEGE